MALHTLPTRSQMIANTISVILLRERRKRDRERDALEHRYLLRRDDDVIHQVDYIQRARMLPFLSSSNAQFLASTGITEEHLEVRDRSQLLQGCP